MVVRWQSQRCEILSTGAPAVGTIAGRLRQTIGLRHGERGADIRNNENNADLTVVKEKKESGWRTIKTKGGVPEYL